MFLCATIISANPNNDGNNENNEIIFELSFQEPKIEKITFQEETNDRITIQGLKNTYDYKIPCLPVKPLKILLPPMHSVKNIEVFTSNSKNLGENYGCPDYCCRYCCTAGSFCNRHLQLFSSAAQPGRQFLVADRCSAQTPT